MKLSVIIPAYNEIKTIQSILEKVLAVDLDKEIIIIDDGSTDGTREFLRNLKQSNIKIIFHSKNQGKGMAIRTGLKEISGDLVVIQDADLEYNPEDYLNLIKPIQEGRAQIVYGSRQLKKNQMSGLSFYLGGRFLTGLTNLLYDAQLTDEPTCYKLFKTEVIKKINLKCRRFEFCPEVTAKAIKLGYKIYEVPISYYPRSVDQGKKINWRDGLEAIWTLIKYRFVN